METEGQSRSAEILSYFMLGFIAPLRRSDFSIVTPYILAPCVEFGSGLEEQQVDRDVLCVNHYQWGADWLRDLSG